MVRTSVVALAGLAAAFVVAAPVRAAPDISVSIGGEIAPGVYGRVDMSNRPPPPLVYPQPVVIVKPPPTVVVAPQPVYMHVPPGHAKNWRKHCRKYDACGVPVYFVKSPEYEPNYRKKGHGEGKGRGKDHD